MLCAIGRTTFRQVTIGQPPAKRTSSATKPLSKCGAACFQSPPERLQIGQIPKDLSPGISSALASCIERFQESTAMPITERPGFCSATDHLGSQRPPLKLNKTS